VLIGDNHFLVGAKKLKTHTLHAPNKKPSSGKGEKKKGLIVEKKIGKEERKALKGLRSRNKLPFGMIKNRFKALSRPLPEGKRQQNYVVYVALGVHNSLIK
jgi:hypothetical protein